MASFCASCLKFLLVSALLVTPLASRIARASRTSESANEVESRVVILPERAPALTVDEAFPRELAGGAVPSSGASMPSSKYIEFISNWNISQYLETLKQWYGR
jgi:hypothetical protein